MFNISCILPFQPAEKRFGALKCRHITVVVLIISLFVKQQRKQLLNDLQSSVSKIRISIVSITKNIGMLVKQQCILLTEFRHVFSDLIHEMNNGNIQ